MLGLPVFSPAYLRYVGPASLQQKILLWCGKGKRSKALVCHRPHPNHALLSFLELFWGEYWLLSSSFYNCTCFLQALKFPYASIIVSNASEMLAKLLSSKLSEKYQLASKFVNVCNLDISEVWPLSLCLSLNHSNSLFLSLSLSLSLLHTHIT